jgi:CheY-like chemotaxis protein
MLIGRKPDDSVVDVELAGTPARQVECAFVSRFGWRLGMRRVAPRTVASVPAETDCPRTLDSLRARKPMGTPSVGRYGECTTSSAHAMQSSNSPHWPRGLQEIGAREAPARVVVAEDDSELRGMLSALLRRNGYEVVEACTGVELLEVVHSMVLGSDGGAPVELVIADVRMPGASGVRAVSELRQSDWNTAVILITAFSDPELSAEAARLGAVVLDKPFDLQHLMWFVRQSTGTA